MSLLVVWQSSSVCLERGVKGNMKDFKEKLAQRESSGDYKAKNKLGYLGKYQFGKLALIDAGYKDKKGNWTGKDGIKSEEDFLNNKEAQESAMDRYTKLQRGYLKSHGGSDFIGKEFKGIPVTESGLVAAAHLVGAKKLSESLKKGEDPKDAFGTPATEYLKKFSGYDLDDKGEVEMREDKLKRMESLKNQIKKPEMLTPEEKAAQLEAMKGAAYADGGKKYSIGYPGKNIPDTTFATSGSKLTEPETYEERLMRSGLNPFKPKSSEAQEVKEDFELAAEEDKTMVDTDPDVLPEEPEDKPEKLTMDTLEQRFQDLMKASKKERQTAAWATAASQIASMIDRASANPIGIKPINFQTGDASAEAKDLLALGKLKGLGVSGGDYSRDPNSEASKRARENARKFGIEIPDKMTEDEIKRLLPSLLAIKRSEMVEFGKAGRQNKALGLQERKFQRKMEESDRPSDKQAERVESLKFAQDLTNKVSDQLTEKMEKFLGPVDSRLEAAKEYIPFTDEGMDPEFAKFKANAVEQLASYIKDKSGAQVSDKERAFLEGALPKVTDKPETFKAKLDMFKERLKMIQEGRLGSIKAQGKNVGEFEKLLNAEDGIDKSTTKSSPSVGSIIRHKGKRYRVVNEAGDLEEVK